MGRKDTGGNKNNKGGKQQSIIKFFTKKPPMSDDSMLSLLNDLQSNSIELFQKTLPSFV
jgi:hypothetical protein